MQSDLPNKYLINLDWKYFTLKFSEIGLWLIYNSLVYLHQFRLKPRRWWNILIFNLFITWLVYKQQSLGYPHTFPCISSGLLSLAPEIQTLVYWLVLGWPPSTNLVAEKINKNPTFHLRKWNLDRGYGQIAEMICIWSFLYFFLDCVATTTTGNYILVVRIFFNLYKSDCFPTEETENSEENWSHPPQLLTLKKKDKTSWHSRSM